MDMGTFINGNREELTRCILNTYPTCRIDDDEIEMWINNDEGLYNWAMGCGVNFNE